MYAVLFVTKICSKDFPFLLRWVFGPGDIEDIRMRTSCGLFLLLLKQFSLKLFVPNGIWVRHKRLG